jgi:hypothetical protein
MIGLSWPYGESRDPDGHRVRAMIPVISWESKARMVVVRNGSTSAEKALDRVAVIVDAVLGPIDQRDVSRQSWLPPVAVNKPTVIVAWAAPQVRCQITGTAPGKGILKPVARR